jgi:phosphoserine aminotransferase
MIVISPRAVERVESYTPSWPLPKVFRLKAKESIDLKLFEGSTINTPSLLCNEDYLQALKWVENIGGLPSLISMSNKNLEVVEEFVSNKEWVDFLVEEKSIRSNTSVCLKINASSDNVKEIVKLLAAEEVAYDCASYKSAPSGIRIWCGPTLDTESIKLMLEWLQWAYNKVCN